MFDELMDQTVSLYRAVIGADASGGTTMTYPGSPTLAGIVCAIQPASANERAIFMRRDIVVDVRIYSIADFDTLLTGGVKLTDKFIDVASVQYIVKSVDKQFNTDISPNPLYKVMCQRIV